MQQIQATTDKVGYRYQDMTIPVESWTENTTLSTCIMENTAVALSKFQLLSDKHLQIVK